MHKWILGVVDMRSTNFDCNDNGANGEKRITCPFPPPMFVPVVKPSPQESSVALNKWLHDNAFQIGVGEWDYYGAPSPTWEALLTCIDLFIWRIQANRKLNKNQMKTIKILNWFAKCCQQKQKQQET